MFNLFVWVTLPPSFLLLGFCKYLNHTTPEHLNGTFLRALHSFIWALISILVTRMMLDLRRVAFASSQHSQTSFFGETALSTQIVWARRTAIWNSSRSTSSHDVTLATIDDRENVYRSTEGGERVEEIELRTYRMQGGRPDDYG